MDNQGKPKTSGKGTKVAWGMGCLLEVAMLIAAVTVLSSDQCASALLYMMLMAVPANFIRYCFFTETTPVWMRAGLGPLGAVLCFAVAAVFPITAKNDRVPEVQTGAEKAKAVEKSAAPAVLTPVEKIDDILAELDGLVGLEGVKAEVHKIVNLVKVNEARRKQGLKVPPMTYHMVFTGNPGTGKTTVARIVARAFVALGIIGNRTIVEVDRSGLVGRYSGETAVKTNAKCDEAIGISVRLNKSGDPIELSAEERAAAIAKAPGGILFIDEAYQLANGDNDSYGKEAIATVLKRMEDNRDKLIVIAAGYTDEMRDFLDANSGLQSRFAKKI